jgi:N-acetylneuraminic acid mutarotase
MNNRWVRPGFFAMLVAAVAACGQESASSKSLEDDADAYFDATTAPDAEVNAPDVADTGVDSSVQPLSDAGALSWHRATALPSPRQSASCVEFGGALYVAGGLVLPSDASTAFTDELLRFDLGSSTWVARTPMPSATCCTAAARLGTKIYVAGGYESDGTTRSNRLLIYDPTSDSWQAGPPMPTRRANAVAVEWNGKLAVVGGGIESQKITGVIELFDPATASWSPGPTAEPTPKATAAIVNANGRMIVAGGYPELSLYGTNTVDVFDTTWSAGPPMPVTGGQMAFGVIAAGLVVAGGWGPTLHSAASAIWDMHSTSWSSLPDMTTARAGACGANVGGDFYAVGGGQFTGIAWTSVSDVEVLRP